MDEQIKNPFPGLRPFEFGDNHLFFGRDEQTTELTTRLRKNRFVAVVGTSGSGKSSLVRAGLLPELLSGTMAGAGSSWETAIMRPGGDPLTNLANAIVEADLYDPEEEDINSQVRATLTRSGLGLVEAMRQSDLPEGSNFLLVVDQFEEIFRFRRSDDATDEQAAFFVNLLLEASAQADLPLYIIITMRSDFLGECSQFPRLADTVNEGEFLIPRLNRDQRKEAIVGPVKVAGGGITDRLLLRLLNDIGDDPDQLPILQHALMRTWDLYEAQGGDGELDLGHYNSTGGMSEALSRHADEVLNEQPDEEHRRIAEKLFKSLTEKVDANRGIRRPMALRELHEICGGEEAHLREVIDSFRRTGCTFLMPAGERKITLKTIIDISHESLMRAWRNLRNWVDEEAQSAKIYRRLADTATLYKEDKAGLYRDPDLQIAISWREANRPNKTWADRYYSGFDGAMAFLDRSHDEAVREEREREEARQREVAQAKALAKARARSATIFKFACVGVTILAITAVFAMLDAIKSKKIAEVKTNQVEDELIKQANRSYSISKSLNEVGKNSTATAWLADAIKLAESDNILTDTLLDSYIDNIIFSPKIKDVINVADSISDIIYHNNKFRALTENKFFDENGKQQLYRNSIPFHSEFTKDFKYIIHFDSPKVIKIWSISKSENIMTFTLGTGSRFDSSKVKYDEEDDIIVVPVIGLDNGVIKLSLSDDTIEKYSIVERLKTVSFTSADIIIGCQDADKFNVYKIDKKQKGAAKNLAYETDGRLKEIIVGKDDIFYLFYEELIINPKIKCIQLGGTAISLNEIVIGNGFNFVRPSRSKDKIYYIDNNKKINVITLEGTNKIIDNTNIYEKFYLSPDNSYLVGTSKELIGILDPKNSDNSKILELKNEAARISFSAKSKEFALFNSKKEGAVIINMPIFKSRNELSFLGRFAPIEININGQKSYNKYRLIFPNLRNQQEIAFQLAELQLRNQEGNNILSFVDTILPTENSQSPKGEEVGNLIDGVIHNKHLNFNTKNPGVVITLRKSEEVSTMTLYSANDIPDRDPIYYKLEGVIGDGEYEVVSEGPIINEEYLKQKKSLQLSLSGYIDASRRDKISNLSKLAFGIEIKDDGRLNQLTTAEIGHLKENEQVKDLKDYLASLSEGGYQWHINSIMRNQMGYFDLFDGNPYSIIEHMKYINSPPEEIKAKLLYFKGLSNFILGNAGQAEKNYLDSLLLASDDFQTQFELAYLYYTEHKFEKSLDIINKFIMSEFFGANRFWSSQFSRLYLRTPIKLDKPSHDRFLKFNRIVEDDTQQNSKDIEDEGNNAYVEIPNNPKLDIQDAITLQFWVKKKDDGQMFGRLLNKGGDNSQDGYSINYYFGMFFFELYNSDTKEYGSIRYNSDQEDWFRVTASWDINTGLMKLYINSDLVSSVSRFEGPIGITSHKLNFGRSASSNQYSNMLMANPIIWNYALTNSEIEETYTNPNSLVYEEAIGNWDLNSDSESGILKSISDAELDGLINGARIIQGNEQKWRTGNYLSFHSEGNESLVPNALVLIKNNKFEGAISLLDLNNSKFDKNVDVYYSRSSETHKLLLALCYHKLGDDSTAKKFINNFNERNLAVAGFGSGSKRANIEILSFLRHVEKLIKAQDD